MLDCLHPSAASMPDPVRARTVLAACSSVGWTREGETYTAPFVDEAGSLLMMVAEDVRNDLLEAGTGRLELAATPAIGVVQLVGTFWPVATSVAQNVLAEVRACHVECADCPNRRITHLVGMQVDQVELQAEGDFCLVDLDAYAVAEPDWFVAVGVNVSDHINAVHQDDVVDAASRFAAEPPEAILTAQIAWMDRSGFEISLIDESGGRWIRVDYSRPVVAPDRLSEAAHAALTRGPDG